MPTKQYFSFNPTRRTSPSVSRLCTFIYTPFKGKTNFWCGECFWFVWHFCNPPRLTLLTSHTELSIPSLYVHAISQGRALRRRLSSFMENTPTMSHANEKETTKVTNVVWDNAFKGVPGMFIYTQLLQDYVGALRSYGHLYTLQSSTHLFLSIYHLSTI